MVPWELGDKGREQWLGQRKNQKAGEDIKQVPHRKVLFNIFNSSDIRYSISFEGSGKMLNVWRLEGLKV